MDPWLPYGRQQLDDDDVAAVTEVLRGPMLTCGPEVERFERALAAAVDASHASVCTSGTAALHLAYAALGLGPGDELITTPITFSATAAAAYPLGIQVRLADVDPRTGNLDPAAVARLIGPRTRAIVPVHLGGRPADLAALAALARQHHLRLIEDACHALGARDHDRPIGSDAGWADAVVFSFHPVKHITSGEGGAVVTRDPTLKRTMDRLRNHGIERDPARLQRPAEGPWSYEVQDAGWNYRLPDILCALGTSQLRKLPSFVARRRALATHYRARLAATFGTGPDAAVAAPLDDATGPARSAYHLLAVAIDFAGLGTTRAAVMAGLAARGIGSQVHYIPLDQHPLHARRCALDVGTPRPGAAHYYARTLSLPLYPALTEADVDRVVDALAATLQELRHERPDVSLAG